MFNGQRRYRNILKVKWFSHLAKINGSSSGISIFPKHIVKPTPNSTQTAFIAIHRNALLLLITKGTQITQSGNMIHMLKRKQDQVYIRTARTDALNSELQPG